MSTDLEKFPGFPKEMVSFMLDLRFNNNKAFMAEQKVRYQSVMRDPHYGLIEVLAPVMRSIDPRMEIRPHKVLSRIYRDTRFSKDKSPYRDHHWIAFRREGEPRESSLMFWFEVRVEGLSWGLGFWGENRPAMEMMRRRMLSHPDDLLNLLPTLSGAGLRIGGDSYRRVNHPESLHKALRPLYALKELYIQPESVDNRLMFSPQLVDKLEKDYRAMAPFYHLLRGYHDIAMLEGSDT